MDKETIIIYIQENLQNVSTVVLDYIAQLVQKCVQEDI